MTVHDAGTVYGWDLNYGQGFKDFSDILDTLDNENLRVGSKWKVRGEVYIVIEKDGKRVFDFLNKEE